MTYLGIIESEIWRCLIYYTKAGKELPLEEKKQGRDDPALVDIKVNKVATILTWER
jgi:hypothetical protein